MLVWGTHGQLHLLVRLRETRTGDSRQGNGQRARRPAARFLCAFALVMSGTLAYRIFVSRRSRPRAKHTDSLRRRWASVANHGRLSPAGNVVAVGRKGTMASRGGELHVFSQVSADF